MSSSSPPCTHLCSIFDNRFLGVDFLLAELLLRTYDANRQKVLKQVSTLLEKFLNRLDSYELLSEGNQRLRDQYQETRETFQLAPATDAAERRRVKVARFQEEKELKTKLEVFGCFERHMLSLTRRTAVKNQNGPEFCR